MEHSEGNVYISYGDPKSNQWTAKILPAMICVKLKALINAFGRKLSGREIIEIALVEANRIAIPKTGLWKFLRRLDSLDLWSASTPKLHLVFYHVLDLFGCVASRFDSLLGIGVRHRDAAVLVAGMD